jgi:hypothetical protein
MGALAPLLSQGRPAFEGLRQTFSVAVRALPPLLAILLFLSLTVETWQTFGDLEGVALRRGPDRLRPPRVADPAARPARRAR